MNNHEDALQKRRDYYRANRAHIRKRDNASARANRASDPDRYRGYIAAYKARLNEKPCHPPTSLETHPEKEKILAAIRQETANRAAKDG